MEESTGEGGLPRIRAQLMQGCASTTNFRPGAVFMFHNFFCKSFGLGF